MFLIKSAKKRKIQSMQVFPVEETNQTPSVDLSLDLKKPDPEENSIKDYYAELMKFPLKILRLVGLYHQKSDHLAFKAYCFTIQIVLWFNFVKMLTVFDFFWAKSEAFSTKLFMKICFTIWTFVCAILATMIFINQEFKNRESDLQTQINLLYYFYSDKDSKKDRKFSRKITAFFLGSLSLLSINCVFMLLSMFGISSFFPAFAFLLAPYHETEWARESIAFKLFMTFVGLIASLYWILTTVYYVTNCWIVLNFLDDFNERFEKFIKENIIVSNNSQRLNKKVLCSLKENIYFKTLEKTYTCQEELEYFRIWHLKLSNAIGILDNCYKHFLGFAIISYTVISLVLVYLMIDWTGNCISGILQIMVPYWCIANLGMLTIKIVFASKLNSKVLSLNNLLSTIKI